MSTKKGSKKHLKQYVIDISFDIAMLGISKSRLGKVILVKLRPVLMIALGSLKNEWIFMSRMRLYPSPMQKPVFCLFGAGPSGFLKVADRTKEGLSCRAVTRNRAGLELKSKRLCELQMKMTFGWRLVETIVIDRFR
ncbi:MAG: hypothetical protein COB05_00915 [Marinobacter sp.]|nr:MAG: hypothetical protein COB05_00915 [Marinobacter sp.]